MSAKQGWFIVVSSAALVLVALVAVIWSATNVIGHFSSQPSASVPSAPAASSLEEELAIGRKNAMVERCETGGGVPVLGYGWRVVCLKPVSAEWWDDPKMPELKKP